MGVTDAADDQGLRFAQDALDATWHLRQARLERSPMVYPAAKPHGLLPLWLLLLASLTACADKVQPEAAVVLPEPLLASPAPAPFPRNHITGLAWAFKSGEQCTATASSRMIALTISATDTAVNWRLQGHLLAQTRQTRVPFRFSARNASWTVLARRSSSGQLGASSSLSEKEVAQVSVLLGGGTLSAGTGATALTLRLPPAGQEGSDWFACVREHLLPARTAS